MKTSFMADLEKKETTSKQKEPSTETAEATATETATEEVAEEAEQIKAEQDTEELPVSEISKETRKQLSDKGSFKDLIKDAELKAQKEAEEEEAALAQAKLEEEEAEQKAKEEEEQEEEVKAPVFEVELDGKKFDTIDAVKAHLNEWNEEKQSLQKEVEEIRSFVEKVSDPELLEVLKYVADGYSYRVAMIKAGMDESIFSIDAEDEDAEALVTAKIERKQAAENQKKEQAKLQKNMEQSNKELEEFQSQEGFDEKTKGDLVSLMTRVHSELLNGLVTKETLGIFANHLNYNKVVEESKKAVEESKKAVEQAKEDGKIAGRNEKIVIERQKKQGDNIPALGRAMASDQPRRENRLKQLVTVPPGSFMDKIRKN